MMGLGLRARLAFVFALGFAVLLGLGALGFYLHLGREYRRDFDRSLLDAARGARALFQLDRPEYGTATNTVTHIVSELVYGDRTLVAYDSLGRALAASPRFPDEPWFNDAPPDAPTDRPAVRTLRDGPAKVVRVILDDGVQVVIAMSTLPLERRMARLVASLLTVLPLILVLGAIAGAWGSALVLRPIVDVARSADRVGQAVERGAWRFEALPVREPDDELRTLTVAFNRLVARLGGALERERGIAERQREFLAEVAHELRTPIAILRSEAEVAIRPGAGPGAEREALERIAGEAAEMGRLVDDLLLVARGDVDRIEPIREQLYLDDVVNTALARARRLPEAKGREIRLGEFEAAPAVGDPGLLERALLVLLTNALVHAPGAPVEVSAGITNGAAPARAWITVRDYGPGVPPEAREQIFERFARLDPGAPGTGLGLPIAQAIAKAHGGEITLEAAKPGAAFTLWVPAAPQ
jgi:two-component system OmpR family sensor kinase